MNISLLEVAMCEKCRSSHVQSEVGGGGGGKGWGGGGGLKNFRFGGWGYRFGGTFAEGSVSHCMPCFFLFTLL